MCVCVCVSVCVCVCEEGEIRLGTGLVLCTMPSVFHTCLIFNELWVLQMVYIAETFKTL